MRHWHIIENWRGQLITRAGEKILEFSFDIVNRTKFPLRLEFITTNSQGYAMQRKADQVLAPEGGSNENKGTTGKLSEEQIRKYHGTKLTPLIEGAVVYEDVFEKRRTHRFNAGVLALHTPSLFFTPTLELRKAMKRRPKQIRTLPDFWPAREV
jgi:hypothetical protein